MTTIIEQALSVWEAKRERMSKEDWMLIADALIEGKKWCKGRKGYGGPKGFGKWCSENGFGSMDRRDRTDAMQVVRKYRDEYLLTDYQSINHPHAFLAGVRKQREIDLGKHLSATVTAWVAKHPDSTAEEIAEGLSLDKEAVRKRTSTWVARGLLKKEQGEEGDVRFQVGDGEPAPRHKTVEDRLAVEAARAGKPVETHLLGQIADLMYWLNTLTARGLNGGTTTLPQVDLETQQEKFQEWLDSFYAVTGRSVSMEKRENGLSMGTKPFKCAPLNIRFDMEVPVDEE